MPPLLEVRGVEAGYGKLRVLHGVDLAVPAGAALAVLGLNGAGKSTLLKVISGLLHPTAGQVRFAGEDVTNLQASELALRGVCLVPEGRGVFPGFTVEDNLKVGMCGRNAGGVERALALLPALASRRRQVAGTLSGGEQQMLAMARAIAACPKLLLLDELSLGLAPTVVETLFGVVADMHDSGTTVVLVEQYVSRALAMADFVAVLDRGRVRFAGEPGELRDGAKDLDAYLGRKPSYSGDEGLAGAISERAGR
ncbi:MAG: ATP-binding cassette domain-containing protein [Actinomycetota bacterium]